MPHWSDLTNSGRQLLAAHNPR